MSLLFVDQKIKKSYVYGGYLILNEIKKKKKISIYDAYGLFQKSDIINSNERFFSLMFLFSLGIIEFKAPYFTLSKK